MTQRKAYTNKILMLGIDGLDPRLAKKYIEEGKMPNLKKYLEHGAANESLVMLGGHPTVTPPMWTTLATGCYANVHGITGFTGTNPMNRAEITYNCDSRLCKAEQLWNVFAEAGKKTLVWHWPGSSWPPSSDSENLFVVDGTSPGGVAVGHAQLESESVLTADVKTEKAAFLDKGELQVEAACVITDLEAEEETEEEEQAAIGMDSVIAMLNGAGVETLLMTKEDMITAATENPIDRVESPIIDAKGWNNAPEDAKEFTVLLSHGLVRRYGLIYKENADIYNRVAIYKSKKDNEPLVVLEPHKIVNDILDDSIVNDTKYVANRDMQVLELAPDASHLKLWISAAMNANCDWVYSPKTLFRELVDNVGYPKPTSLLAQQDAQLINCMVDSWQKQAEWQSSAILHLINSKNLDVVFSHFHNVDMLTHQFLKHMSAERENRIKFEECQKLLDRVYQQTDYYLGQYIHLLDEDWTILIFSDHGLVCSKYDKPLLGEPGGVNVPIMRDLGYTVLKKDANGNDIKEIDWSKTKAIAVRDGHIYLNLKGRDPYGIVDPEDQFELEEQIITDLYGVKHEKTGHRVVSVALRNKDAVLLGQGGPEAGDICYWMAEGYNYDHGDCLSTSYGEANTSVSPIFIASGKGIKKNFKTDRIIRQIDFVATVAALGGVRMPAQCEGAPAYQIFEEEF